MSKNPRREELKALSQPFSILKKQGAIESINEALVQLYKDQGFEDLKSLYQWNQEGRKVKRGEKAILLWGRPTRRQKEASPAGQTPETDESELDFYPLAYVFDISQTVAND